GNSVRAATDLPLNWTKSDGITWSTASGDYGQSSPVVWNDRVFVTSAVGKNKEKVAVTCVDLATGKTIWSKALKSSTPEKVTGYISVAAPTPVVDAKRLYAFFETGDLVAISHDGSIQWQRRLAKEIGAFKGNHGLGASLAVTDNAVLALICHDGPSYLLAVDKVSGKTLWKTDRSQKVSWTSPIVDRTLGTARVIVSSAGTCEELDARDGKQIWIVKGLDGNTVPSATVTKDYVIVGSREVNQNLAIRRGGKGDVTATHIAWRSKEATSSFSSPLVYQGRVYSVNRAGVAYCMDIADGKTLWKKRIAGACWASPLGVADRVYFFCKSGETSVVATGPEFKLLAENDLEVEDRVYGIAAVNKTIVVRTGSKLFAVRSDVGP
ncbi:MAG: PQQ-binding-like beta-propeller repeat protein, partial [Pirellulales bacterium]|nr:PQQ-binding-like beta-propeller repeat protein [Pirellulales bacterium]